MGEPGNVDGALPRGSSLCRTGLRPRGRTVEPLHQRFGQRQGGVGAGVTAQGRAQVLEDPLRFGVTGQQALGGPVVVGGRGGPGLRQVKD